MALGHQPPDGLVAEARTRVEAGYRAVKLRIGDTVRDGIARTEAARRAFGEELDILADADTAHRLEDARRAVPAVGALDVGRLEEPFPPHDRRDYAQARGYGRAPLAAGENHFARFEFAPPLDDGAVGARQPDLSKCGGIAEAPRIAAIASARKIPAHPHGSMTGINQAATIRLLRAIDDAGHFEADVPRGNLFRDAPWSARPGA